MQKKHSPQSSLLNELSAQFPEVRFELGESVNKKFKELIFLDGSEVPTSDFKKIITTDGEPHPDFEIILEKFDAEVKRQGETEKYVIIPDHKVIKKEKNGYFVLREKLLVLLKK